MAILPPNLVYAANRVSDEDFSVAAKAWQQRLLTLADTEPIPYRRQNGGDYEQPALLLREGLEAVDDKGFRLHLGSMPVSS
jgi:NAD(P)H dehydrogenase (quinone)